jgi:hypothetical protein
MQRSFSQFMSRRIHRLPSFSSRRFLFLANGVADVVSRSGNALSATNLSSAGFRRNAGKDMGIPMGAVDGAAAFSTGTSDMMSFSTREVRTSGMCRGSERSRRV